MAAEGGPSIVRDGIGIMIDPSNSKSIPSTAQTNLLDYSTWIPGNDSATGFSRNGDAVENLITAASGPFAEPALIWQTLPSGNGNPDGGWNSGFIACDKTKLYRFSIWMRRTSSTSGGTFYLGTNGGGECVYSMSTGAAQCNPYWECSATSRYTQNQWYLVVGHIHPHGTQLNTQHLDTGIYTINGGKVMSINGCNVGSDVLFGANTTSIRHRTYHYYCNDNTTRLEFAYPRIELCNGTQPTVGQLLGGFGVGVVNLANRLQTTFLKNNLRIKATSTGNAKALNMDGTNDYVKVTGGTTTSLKRSIEIVFKANSQPSTYNPIAVFTNESSIVTGKRTWLGIQAGKFQMHGWGTNDPNSTTTISNGTYYHIVYAYDQTIKKHYIWVNGNLERELTNTEAGMTGWSNSSDHFWFLGRDPLAASWTGGAGNSFHGEIALFRTYSRLLTNQQVSKNFRSIRRKYGI